jgi:hypothetical protein
LESFLARGLRWAGSGVGGDYGEKLSRGDITLGPIKFPHEVVSYAGLVQRGSESTKLQAGVIAILFRSLALSALLISMRRQPKSGPNRTRLHANWPDRNSLTGYCAFPTSAF